MNVMVVPKIELLLFMKTHWPHFDMYLMCIHNIHTYFIHKIMSAHSCETKVGFNMQSEWVLGKWKTVIYLWIEWWKPQQTYYAMVGYCVHFVNNHTIQMTITIIFCCCTHWLWLSEKCRVTKSDAIWFQKKNNGRWQSRWWASERMSKGSTRKRYSSYYMEHTPLVLRTYASIEKSTSISERGVNNKQSSLKIWSNIWMKKYKF